MGVVEQFKTLVPIANPSGGEEVIRQYVVSALAQMGLTSYQVDDTGNLFVRVPGQPNTPPLLFAAHLDSVPPCHGIVPVEDTAEDGRPILRSEGKTILGADDKAGIAVILELVHQLAQQQFQHNAPLELLFTTQEEVGLLGAKAFDVSQISAPYAYVLDGEGQVGEIFHAGPSQENLQITCHGKRSHAGIAPEEGISAIEMGAAILSQVPSGRLSPTLTTNIGVAQGGAAMNIVAPKLTLKGEARGHQEADLMGLLATYEKTCRAVEKAFPGSIIEFIHTRRYDRFEVPSDHLAVQRAMATCQRLNIPARVLPMNIGSDAHQLNHQGIPTVVLGMGFHFSHSLGEFIYCDELEQVVQWVLALVR